MTLLIDFLLVVDIKRYAVFYCRGCFSNGSIGRVTSFGDGLRRIGGSTSIVIRTEYQVCVGHCDTTISLAALFFLTFHSTLSMQLNGG